MQVPPRSPSGFLTVLAIIAVGPSFTACAGPVPQPPAPEPSQPRERSAAQVATPVAQPTPPATPVEVSRRFPILNGRLTALLPTGSHEVESEDGTPALEPGEAGSNSRHAVSAGSFEVTVAAFELFARVEADFERQVREGVARWEHPPSDYRLEPVAARPPLRVLLLTPVAPLPSGISEELAHVCLLYVAHPDGTVQAIELHAPRAAAVTTVLELAKRIGESLDAGPLPLAHVAGARTLWRIVGEVPDGFVGIAEPGMDFYSASLVELSPIASPTRTISMSVAEVGPNWFPGRPVAGRLFGRSTTLYAERTGGLWRLHGLVRFDDQSVAVDLSAPTSAGLAGLRAIAGNLRWVASPETAESP